MNNPFGSLLGFVAPFMLEMRDMKKETAVRKDRILSEWIESGNLPRKKKKAKRKHLQLEWNIACWGEDLFKDVDIDTMLNDMGVEDMVKENIFNRLFSDVTTKKVW